MIFNLFIVYDNNMFNPALFKKTLLKNFIPPKQ